MARKFVGQKEIDFIDGVTKELLQGVVEQEVHYYAIVLEQTAVHSLYNEAIKKTWAPPVKLNALVSFDQPSTVSGRFGPDTRFNTEVYFHNRELRERNVVAREGDFLEYGGVFYEITSATQPQLVFGQINNKVMTKCLCVPSRQDQFQAGSRAEADDVRGSVVETADPSTPVNRLDSGSLGDYATNRLSTVR